MLSQMECNIYVGSINGMWNMGCNESLREDLYKFQNKLANLDAKVQKYPCLTSNRVRGVQPISDDFHYHIGLLAAELWMAIIRTKIP